MNSLVVIPTTLHDAINEKLDTAIKACPGAEVDRDELYSIILGYVDEHGCLPNFTIKKREEKK